MATNKAWEGNLRTGNAGARKKDKQNISVFVRCRPFSEEEKKTGVAKVVSCNHTDVEVGGVCLKIEFPCIVHCNPSSP